MRVRSFCPFVALLALAVACAACGDTVDDAGSGNSSRLPHWQIHDGRDRTVQVVLPDARWGTPDPDGAPSRLVVDVPASGDVLLKGHTWKLRSGDDAKREASIEGLRAQLRWLSVEDRGPDAEDAPPRPVLLHADREAPWRAIREVLAVLRAPGIPARKVGWSVQASDSSGPARWIHGTLRAAGEAAGESLGLRIVPEQGASWLAVRIFSPAGIHSFGPQPGAYSDERFLRRANATWDELERALPALAAGHDAASVEVLDEEVDVWFAYVVKAVDLLFDAGFEEVRLPREGLVMRRPAGGS